MERQDALAAQLRPPKFPYAKVGRVISVTPADQTVDLAFEDSGILRQVPICSGWAGSTMGFAHLSVPAAWKDRDKLSWKTYPEPENKKGIAYPPADVGHIGRDMYAVVVQIEGAMLGTSGYVAVGFFYAQVSEMLFPRKGLEEEFAEFMLVRHPADVQTTMDRYGVTSVQHPAEARLTIDHREPGGDTAPTWPDAVDLKKKDFDELYELRNNLIHPTKKDDPIEDDGRRPQLLTRVARWLLDEEEEIQRVAGHVYHWLAHTCAAYLLAVWTDADGLWRGKIKSLAGEYHATRVLQGDIVAWTDQGDILESARGANRRHATEDITEDADGDIVEKAGGDLSEDVGGSASRRAAMNMTFTAGAMLDAQGEVSAIVRNDAGCFVQMTPAGNVEIFAPVSIVLMAMESIVLKAPLISENPVTPPVIIPLFALGTFGSVGSVDKPDDEGWLYGPATQYSGANLALTDEVPQMPLVGV
jgi:hypothetical protein